MSSSRWCTRNRVTLRLAKVMVTTRKQFRLGRIFQEFCSFRVVDQELRSSCTMGRKRVPNAPNCSLGVVLTHQPPFLWVFACFYPHFGAPKLSVHAGFSQLCMCTHIAHLAFFLLMSFPFVFTGAQLCNRRPDYSSPMPMGLSSADLAPFCPRCPPF